MHSLALFRAHSKQCYYFLSLLLSLTFCTHNGTSSATMLGNCSTMMLRVRQCTMFTKLIIIIFYYDNTYRVKSMLLSFCHYLMKCLSIFENSYFHLITFSSKFAGKCSLIENRTTYPKCFTILAFKCQYV